MTQTPDAQRIGRFRVLRTLGRGAQGSVYLGEDTQLRRQVAIKTLRRGSRSTADGVNPIDTLRSEAQIVSQLSHPNIVTLHDAAEEGGRPYLVFEFVDGRPLSILIKQTGASSPAAALALITQILRGVAYAHSKGVIHRDLKPANVLVTFDGTARITDFGIAQSLAVSASTDRLVAGTPAYMAPEQIEGKAVTPRSDLFSVGLILYELLTGRPAVSGTNALEILHRLANETLPPPSKFNAAVDERLDDLVLKALARDPLNRYEDATAMQRAIDAYLRPPPPPEGEAVPADQSTLDFLLRRMRHKSDFPALSTTIGAVNRAAANETERVTAFADRILRDFALTNKLLKLVNSACYQQFGGAVSTVSRAVMIMGFDNIRNLAVSLLLFEHLQNKSFAAQMKEEALAAYLSGVLARQLSPRTAVSEPEAAFIGAMFHDLGRLLTLFYFPEEYGEIRRLLCQQEEMSERRAVVRVLGIPYPDLAMGVARAWNFPDNLIATMRQQGDGKVRTPKSEEQRLAMVSELAASLCTAMRVDDPARRKSAFASLAARFGSALGVKVEDLEQSAAEAALVLVSEMDGLGLRPGQSPLMTMLAQWGDEPEPAAPGTHARLPAPAEDEAARLQARTILNSGIQDITNALVGSFELNDLLRMILETMFRGIGFRRVLLLIRSPQHNALRARFGFGTDAVELIRQGFGVPLSGNRDAFLPALTPGTDVLIDDVDGERVREHIPAWYRRAVTSRSLLLLPVVVGGQTLGLFYGDKDTPLALAPHSPELEMLKTLRNQAVLAIRQKQ